MTPARHFVDVHVLHDLPPSNINRDDNGTPKQAVYGGVDRLRVSSQAWKRATRRHFAERMDEDQLGVRTRRLHALLTGLLKARGRTDEEAKALAAAALEQLGIKAGRKADESSYLLFAGREQLATVADALAGGVDGWEQLKAEALKEAVKQLVDVPATLGSTHPLDVALFGRMVADLTQLNVDAAAQVAHAISTHAAQTQFDYFTAVDDTQEKDEAGAAMIGTVEFNSATMYRFATVAFDQLVENLADRDAAVSGVAQFITSFAQCMPTGHQNSFAPRTRPALVAVVVRDDQPVNLVSAFEAPVRSRTGFLAESQRRLAEHYLAEVERWGDVPRLVTATYASGDPKTGDALKKAFGPSTTFDDLVSSVKDVLASSGEVHA